MLEFKPAAYADAACESVKLCALIGLPIETCDLLAVLEAVVSVEAPLSCVLWSAFEIDAGCGDTV